MKKNLLFVILTVFFAFANFCFGFAQAPVGWYSIQENSLWYYVKENEVLARNEWLWLEKVDMPGVKRHYYFNNDAFLLCNGVTPDGKKTNAQGEEIDANGNAVEQNDVSTSVILPDTSSVESKMPDAQPSSDAPIVQPSSNAPVAVQNAVVPEVQPSSNAPKSQEQTVATGDIKYRFLNTYMTYKLKLDNRAVALGKIFGSEITKDGVNNGLNEQKLANYYAELEMMYNEGNEALTNLMLSATDVQAAMFECEKYKNLLNGCLQASKNYIKNAYNEILHGFTIN